ncbi:MAG: HEPN domain-containing protein [Parvibaculum sp.]|uniref:HEPN domain-containing protein n=1 Tax=Alphaproteobacteria TaxID=28211 RepID=UPI003297DF4E
MNKITDIFSENIEKTIESFTLYDYLKKQIITPINLDDLLRSQIVYAVSAFDKLMHDLIKTGMIQIYMNKRQATPKYLSEPIALETHKKLNDASIPPREIIFEREISKKLKHLSFQEPGRVADGLSLIWNENQKWQKIAAELNTNHDTARTTLKLIVDRRNSIVHESDMDPITQKKLPISRNDSIDAINYINHCGLAIARLVELKENTV